MAVVTIGQVGAFSEGTTEPSNTKVIWLDTNTAPATFKVYDPTQSDWVNIEGTSGQYTPTLTGVANVASSTPLITNFSKVSDVVTVSGGIEVTPTAGATFTRIRVSLPIASNLSGSITCRGTGTSDLNSSTFVPVFIRQDAANDEAEFVWTSQGTTAEDINFVFVYQIG